MKPEDQIEESLLRVAYGEAGLLERLRVRKLVGRDAQARQLLEEHMRLSRATKALRAQLRSPERVVQQVHALRRWSGTREQALRWRPVFGGVAAMALAAIAVVFVMKDKPPHETTPAVVEYNEFGLTQQEMERARVEAETCLTLFATALSGAGSMSHTIAEDAVAPRISQGLERAQSFIF